MLDVGPVMPVNETLFVSNAALLARGQLVVGEGGRFTPVDTAFVFAFILTTATPWTSVPGVTEDTIDTGAYLESPSGGLRAQPRTARCSRNLEHSVRAGSSSSILQCPAKFLVSAVIGMADAVDEAEVLLQTMTANDDRTFSVHHRAAGWVYPDGPTGSAVPDAQGDAAAVSDMLTDLASFTADFPGTR